MKPEIDGKLVLAEKCYKLLSAKVFKLKHVISTSLSLKTKKFKVEVDKGTLEITQMFIQEELRKSGKEEEYMESYEIIERSRPVFQSLVKIVKASEQTPESLAESKLLRKIRSEKKAKDMNAK